MKDQEMAQLSIKVDTSEIELAIPKLKEMTNAAKEAVDAIERLRNLGVDIQSRIKIL